MNTDEVPVTLHAPPDAHPGVLSGLHAALTSAMTAAYQTRASVSDAAAALDEKAAGGRPKPPGKRMSEAERMAFNSRVSDWRRDVGRYKAELARGVTPKIERALSSFDQAISSAKADADALQRDIDKTLSPGAADTAFDVEIRAALKGKNVMELSRAVESDARVCAAILGAPSVVLGVDEKTLSVVRGAAVAKWAPEKQARLESLRRDLERATRARDSFREWSTESLAAWRSEEQDIIAEALR